MAYNRYTVGQAVILTGTYTTPAGALQDPTAAHVTVVDPTGLSTDFTALQLVHVSTGVYTYTVDTTGKVGRWQYLWWSPGPVGQSADNNEFFTDPFPSLTP